MTYLMLAAYGNAARRAPVASSGCINPSNLASSVIGKKARFPTGAGSVDFVFANPTTVRALALNGVVNDASGTHTAQFDLSALAVGGSEILTTAKTLAPVDGYGGLCCWDLEQDYAAVKFMRVTLTGVSEVGLVWASPAWPMTYGASYPYSSTRRDLSTVTVGDLSGVRTHAKRFRQREDVFTLDFIAHEDYNNADTLDLVSGTTEQILIIWDPPGRGADKGPIMGVLNEASTMTIPDAARWSSAWKITQSL